MPEPVIGAERKRRVVAAAIAMFTAFSLLGVSCSSNNAPSNATPEGGTLKVNEANTDLEPDDPPVKGGKLIVAVAAESNGWNPSVNQWADAGSLEGPSMIEPMVVVDGNGEALPWLLDKWEPVAGSDFKQWDLTLHPDIKFHNGKPLDSKALKQSIDFIYQNGLTKIALESKYDKVEITGDLSVRVFLKVKWAQYPAAMNNIYAMAPEMLNREDKGVVAPIGTGPFVFDEWKQGDFLRANRNPNYWRKDSRGNQLPYLDSIEFRPIIDDSSRAKALKSGDIEMAQTTQASMASDLESDFHVLRDYTSERTFIMLNTLEGEQNKGNPFTNIHARKAMQYATDREAIAADIDPRVITTTQGYREGSKWHVEGDTGYPDYDVEKAKQEVELFKKDTGKSELSFELTGLSNPDDNRIMQQLQAQWKQAGITANLAPVDQTKYISLIALGLYQAGWFRWYGYPNPDNNYVYNSKETNNPIGGISINFTHYSSETMETNLHTTRENLDFDVRKKSNDAVVKETNEAAINIWLYDTPYALIATKRVRGLNRFIQFPFGNFTPKPWWGEVWLQS
jgi:peptide/nickel transport system substrate-binding protein